MEAHWGNPLAWASTKIKTREVLAVGGLQRRERRLVALDGVDELLRRRQQAQVLVVDDAVAITTAAATLRRRGVGGGRAPAPQHDLAQRQPSGGLALRCPVLVGLPRRQPRGRRHLRPLHAQRPRAREDGATREHAVGVGRLEVAQAHLQVGQRAGGRRPAQHGLHQVRAQQVLERRAQRLQVEGAHLGGG
eukprot:scaffold13265_cov61-Phaeocystis_antarctica.AAC.7